MTLEEKVAEMQEALRQVNGLLGKIDERFGVFSGVLEGFDKTLQEQNRIYAESEKRAAERDEVIKKREAAYDARQEEARDLQRRNVVAWEKIAEALTAIAAPHVPLKQSPEEDRTRR